MSTQQFDEGRWPDLTRFRDACLSACYDEMQRIADKEHQWYADENPQALSMAKLSALFRAQHYAAQNELAALKALVAEEPWVVNYPWTAQEWLPITQAAGTHGDRQMIEFLLESGADPTLSVGDPDDRATVPEMARYGGHEELAAWLDGLVKQRSE